MAFIDKEEIGKRLKTKREALGYSSARKFAMIAGIDQSQYSKIEKGELPITEKIVTKLVTAYNLNKDWILYGTNVPRENRHNEEKKDYLSGKNLENFSEAHRQLATAIAHALQGNPSDQVLAPKIAQWLREVYSGKKEVPIDELLKELQKASMPDSSYRQ